MTQAPTTLQQPPEQVLRASRAPEREALVEVLQWAAERFRGSLALASSFGLEDQVLAHAIATAGLQIPVFTLDTGRLFPHTYDLITRTQQVLGLQVRVYFPAATAVETLVNAHGVNCFRRSVELRKKCCRVRKLEPLARALAGLQAWLTGIRRGQASTRVTMELLEWDQTHGLAKFNPLLHWSAAAVRAYLDAHHVPHHPLHDRGFPSIGCACCTRAVREGEHERAGRWWWEQEEKKECGLHLRPARAAAAKEHA